ncbi:hypothetical protein [Microbacterium sp.]|uniref:hypothetical protein n=1 Tax=Microbacterium sp. TaxID=51671 RepID=UPI0039E580A5
MTEPTEQKNISRRTVVKGAAWAAPVIAVAVAAPLAAATVVLVATSIGATTTSPIVNQVGRIRPFGIDANGDDGKFPAGQTFTLTSAELDFDSIITSITGGTVTKTGTGTWIITPAADVVAVDIRFTSSVAGSYTLVSNGPVSSGTSWGGSVIEPA